MTGMAATFKAAGAVCILAGSAGWGMAWIREERRRVEYLREILCAVRRMKDEIAYGKRTLPELSLLLSECCGPLYCGCFRNIYELAGREEGASIARIWEEQLTTCQQEAPLSGEEKAVLACLPRQLGMQEEKQQARNIGRYEEFILESCRRTERAYADKTKMIFSVSVLAGVFLTILLL